MNHLVLGGTGTVGSAVVRGLLERGEGVRVLTRTEERARTLPEGATPVVGDLTDPDTYGHVFTDFDSLFLLIANSIAELHEGLAALNEARRAGVKRIVYLSVHGPELGPHIPHFSAKTAIEDAIKQSGIPYTILRPNNFYQNDYWFKDAIVDYGVYPQPIGDVGVSRVDVRDIGEAAVNALTGSGYEGRTYTLAGPEPLTGEDCARVYGEALGRQVRYGGNDLEAFSQQLRQMVPGWMAWDFQLMYAMFQKEGLAATDEQLRETEEIVGHAPRRFDAFVQETVAAW